MYGGMEAFKQGNGSSSSEAHSLVECELDLMQEYYLGLERP